MGSLIIMESWNSMPYTRRSLVLASAMLPLLWRPFERAQSATPSASPLTTDFGPASERITRLLDILPGGILDDSLNLYWTDFERQFAHVAGDTFLDSASLMPPFSIQDDLVSLNAFQLLEQDLGFGPANIQQTLVSGNPPRECRLYVLDADVTTLSPIWEAAGYEIRESDSGTYWTIGEDGEINLTNPIHRVALAKLNNIAIVDERTLACAPTAEILTLMMAAATSNGEGKRHELKPVTAGLPEDAASAWYLEGSTVAATNPRAPEELAESDDAVGPMPVIRTLCVGVTAGASNHIGKQAPDAQAFLLMQTDEFDMAKQVAAVVEWRMREMTSKISSLSFTNMLGQIETDIVSGNIVRFSVGGNSAQRFDFAEMIYQGDIWPLAYIPEV